MGAYNKNTLIAPMEISGTLKKIDFTFWFSKWLLPNIPFGSTIILDNASIHDKKELARLAKEAGCEIIFLPPYSPQYSENSALPGLKSGASAFEAFSTNLKRETFTILVIGC